MQNLITAYLFENGQCSLPGIGRFQIQHEVAKYDITKKEMQPPYERIIFEEKPAIKTGNLIESISLKKGVSKDVARELLEDYSAKLKHRLDNKEVVELITIGSLSKKDNGKIEFVSSDTLSFVSTLYAEKLHNVQPNHSVRVGEKLVNASEMRHPENKIYSKFTKYLWIYNIIFLALVCLVIAIIHFYGKSINSSSVGNQAPIETTRSIRTYE